MIRSSGRRKSSASRGKVRLRPVSPPFTSNMRVVKCYKNRPTFIGEGGVDMLCSKCDKELARSVEPRLFRNTVFKCAKCGQHNLVVAN